MIVGIGGGGASGKTTLARTLEARLTVRAEVIHLDDYWLEDRSNGPWMTSPSTGERHFNVNHPDSTAVHRALGALDQALETNAIVIIEGMFALHFERIRERCDLRIFVDLEADVRALRKVIRNQQERGRPPQITARNYLESAREGHERFVKPSKVFADLIVRGDANLERTASILTACINSFSSAP